MCFNKIGLIVCFLIPFLNIDVSLQVCYGLWCRSTQTKNSRYKWEIYNQEWYYFRFFVYGMSLTQRKPIVLPDER